MFRWFKLRSGLTFIIGFWLFNGAVPAAINGLLHIDLSQRPTVALTSGGKYTAVGINFKQMEILDSQSGKRLADFTSKSTLFNNNSYIYVPELHEFLEINGSIYSTDTISGDEKSYSNTPICKIGDVSMSADSKWLADCACPNSTWNLWSIEQHALVPQNPPLKCPKDQLSQVISPDVKRVAFLTNDSIQIYDVGSTTLLQKFALHVDPPAAYFQGTVLISPDNRWLLVDAHQEKPALLYDIATGQIKCPNLPLAYKEAFAPNGAYVALGEPGSLSLWNLNTCAVEREIKYEYQVQSQVPDNMAFSWDSRMIFADFWGSGKLFRWDVATGQALASLPQFNSSALAWPVCIATPIVYVILYIILIRVLEPIPNQGTGVRSEG